MKDDLLKRSWEGIGSQIHSSSEEDIENMMRSKSKKVTDSFLLASITGIIVFPILFVVLCIVMIHRWDDMFYRFNALFLCAYSAYKLYNSISAFYKIRYIGPNLPLKDWLKRWVDYKQKFGKARSLVSIAFIPVFITSLYLSVYIYVTDESVPELLKNPSFSIGFLSGMIGARIAAIFIRRKRQVSQLQYLQDLYNEIHEG